MKTKAKKARRAEPRFKKGDRVRVTAACVIPEFVGVECTVRRVFGDRHGDGAVPRALAGTEGWVCEVDVLFQPGRPEYGFRCFWETLLEPVNS